jgi:hypothetical protein
MDTYRRMTLEQRNTNCKLCAMFGHSVPADYAAQLDSGRRTPSREMLVCDECMTVNRNLFVETTIRPVARRYGVALG